ncbi:hypothetical protein [Butyrivibrio fibrisolvens]|uniref:Uncharacterized protein n=1 Tax=Butyrivibrio fibrisolvens TaxID=831 RepID=A0A317FZV9_BUTFI|nr:hypothetical protein [Butyrivibrio fibrisolvens]PWT26596.1 hypothetical protein CPT75_05380 [Butyrivibrio fibrisolvens]
MMGTRTKSNTSLIDKIKSISKESTFYIYILFNLINLIIHIMGFFSYPMFAQVDYVLYLTKIAIVFLVRKALLKKDSRFFKEARMFKGIIICDCIELFVSVFAYSDEVILIISLTFTLKALLDYIIFSSFINKGIKDAYERISEHLSKRLRTYKKYWHVLNISILGVLIFQIYAKKTFILMFFFALVLVRFFAQINFIYLIWNKVIKQHSTAIDHYYYEKRDAKLVSSSNHDDDSHIKTGFAAVDERDYELKNLEKSNQVQDEFKKQNKLKNKLILQKIKNFSLLKKLINKFPRIDKKYRYAIYGCLFICFLFMRNTYIEGDNQLIDENGNVLSDQKSVDSMYCAQYIPWDSDEKEQVYQYNKCNLMPSWSMFYDEKYGLVNIETGLNTGAIYEERLDFDKEEIAYDYDRHFINLNGEEVIKVPYIVKAKTSFRQMIVNKLLDYSNTNDNGRHTFLLWDSCYESGKFVQSSNYTYFANGVTSYHTDLNDKYGLMSKDGHLITLPKYSYITGKRDFIVSLVINYNCTALDVINSKGESLVESSPHSIEFYDAPRIIKCRTYQGNEFYTYNGEKIDGSYYQIDKTGLVTCFIKHDNPEDKNGTLEVYYYGSELIFSSDLYKYCYSYPDKNGKINYLVVEDKDNMYSLIDLEGNLICPDSYKKIKRTGDYNTFVGVNNNGQLDLLHLDGTVIKTYYTYVNMTNEKDWIKVCNPIPKNLYNYIDLQGNVKMEEWFEDDDAYYDN